MKPTKLTINDLIINYDYVMRGEVLTLTNGLDNEYQLGDEHYFEKVNGVIYYTGVDLLDANCKTFTKPIRIEDYVSKDAMDRLNQIFANR